MANREIPKGCVAVPITKDEKYARGLELAELTRQVRTLDAEWTLAKQEHGKKLTGLEERMKRLADDVATGTEIVDSQTQLPWDSESLRGAVADKDDDAVADEEPSHSNGKSNGHAAAPATLCSRCHHSREAHLDGEAPAGSAPGACNSDGCGCGQFATAKQKGGRKKSRNASA